MTELMTRVDRPDADLPRIDRVVEPAHLAVSDIEQQMTLTGVPTAGASLDNLKGVAEQPEGYRTCALILIAPAEIGLV